MTLEEFKKFVAEQKENSLPKNWMTFDLGWAIADRLIQIEEKLNLIIRLHD
jgi:hypothetical protein